MSKWFIAIFLICFASGADGQTAQAVNRFNESGLTLYAKGDYRRAVAEFTRAIDLATGPRKNGNMRNNLGDGAEPAGEPFRDDVRVVNPHASGLYVNRGNAFFILGETARAIDDYDRAIRMSPSLSIAYICRGSAWLFSRELDRALADYEVAIKLDPRNVKGYIGRGMTRLDRGDKASAFADFDRAVEFAPGTAAPYYHRGDARRVSGEIDAAATDFERAIRLDPRFPESYLGRGTIRLHNRDYDGAIADFTIVLRLDGRLAQAYRNRGYAYFASGKIVEAESDFERAVTLAPHMRAEIDVSIERLRRSN